MESDLVIRSTTDYDRFEHHPVNRSVKNTDRLRESMEKHGFLYDKHLTVNELENGKLRIREGHHRFHVARHLGIPLYYVIVPETDFSIYDSEDTTKPWRLEDYLDSYCNAGMEQYIEVKRYRDNTGIPLMCCISMLGGQSAGSGNFNVMFKSGKFKIKDSGRELANKVARIVLLAHESRLDFAKQTNFVRAVCNVVQVDELDYRRLTERIKRWARLIESSTTIDGYLASISAIYARGNRSINKLWLKMVTEEAARQRSAAPAPYLKKNRPTKFKLPRQIRNNVAAAPAES